MSRDSTDRPERMGTERMGTEGNRESFTDARLGKKFGPGISANDAIVDQSLRALK